MRQNGPENAAITDDSFCEGFASTSARNEARRQVQAGAAVSALILLAFLVSVLFGTS